jgi:UDP-N-acetylglucosamine--N-acetylmuramyl-(pentapeptide) pyrophosphoryl-undecaprenol N-acetylglucosamine transferase
MKTLMIMAGGTGGHVYPAMAVADHLVARGWQIIWLVTEGGMENRLVADKPYHLATIHMRGVRGKGVLRWIALPLHLLRACLEAARALRTHHPHVVLGMGGFAAFPGGVMAWLMRKPLVIHEQNSIAGLTNRVLSRFATRVLAAFPSAFGPGAEVTGNPVRADIAAIAPPQERFFGRSGPLRLLVTGGSLGAQVLNEVVPQALAMLPPHARPRVIHQAGVQHIEALRENYRRVGVEAETRPYLEDMAGMYAWCDLAICRAGALTIAELTAAGVPAVLVPFPHAVDDHQTHNARYLSESGAAILVPQPEFTPQRLRDILADLPRSRLQEMAERARALGKPRATQAVAAVCEELAHAA